MKTFYKPTQGDTAAVVADGYDNNFQSLDAAKADAAATAAALAEKVDKVEGQSLMTSEERAKLAGIEEGANAYVLPQASAETLGGIKVGNNLIMREDGTLDAPYAGGLDPDTLSPVAQISSSDRLLAFSPSGEPQTAIAAQVSDYVQAHTPQPTYRNLCLNSRGDNLNCWDPWSGADRIEIDTAKFGRPVIKLTNQFIGSSGQWWFGIACEANLPDLKPYLRTTTPLPCPVTVSYNVWCNYAVSLSAGQDIDPVTIEPDRLQRVSHTIPAGTVVDNIGFGVGLVSQKTDLEIYYEMMQVEYGTLATPYTYNPTLPYSLTEQLVPGEFWEGKQVYQRTFKGSVHGAIGGNYIARNCFNSGNIVLLSSWGSLNGYLSGDTEVCYSFPVGTNWNIRTENDSLAYSTERADMGTMTYNVTIKYVQ